MPLKRVNVRRSIATASRNEFAVGKLDCLRSLFRIACAAIATPKPKPILAGTNDARQSEHRINNNNQLLLNTNVSATPLLEWAQKKHINKRKHILTNLCVCCVPTGCAKCCIYLFNIKLDGLAMLCLLLLHMPRFVKSFFAKNTQSRARACMCTYKQAGCSQKTRVWLIIKNRQLWWVHCTHTLQLLSKNQQGTIPPLAPVLLASKMGLHPRIAAFAWRNRSGTVHSTARSIWVQPTHWARCAQKWSTYVLMLCADHCRISIVHIFATQQIYAGYGCHKHSAPAAHKCIERHTQHQNARCKLNRPMAKRQRAGTRWMGKGPS